MSHFKHSFSNSNIIRQVKVKCLFIIYRHIYLFVECSQIKFKVMTLAWQTTSSLKHVTGNNICWWHFLTQDSRATLKLCLLHKAIDHQEDVLIKKMWQVRSLSSFQTSWLSKRTLIKHSQHIFIGCPVM